MTGSRLTSEESLLETFWVTWTFQVRGRGKLRNGRTGPQSSGRRYRRTLSTNIAVPKSTIDAGSGTGAPSIFI
jgi:hypothetical protein